jgi:CPA2 family monovalent cation:H+ antiporter-2
MHLLNEIVIVLGLSTVVVLVCDRIRVPSIIGFLLVGVLAGPSGLGLVTSREEVDTLAEIGVILLLFTVGIEFSFRELFRMKRNVFAGGTLQMVLAAGGSLLLALAWGRPPRESTLIGLLVAMSSTAIVLKLLKEKAEIDTPHGRISLGILIFQDVMIVPVMLVIPLMAGARGPDQGPWYVFAAKIVLAIAAVVAGAKWIVPGLLLRVARTRSRELFLMTVIVLCFVVAWISASIGLSLALGAFMAGMIISESDYSHQALSSILPFRDVFMSVFFVSVGMLLDGGYFVDHVGTVAVLTLAVLALKTVAGSLAALVLRQSPRTVILSGLALCQVGEFSFLLAGSGLSHGLLSEGTYQMFLAVSILTMAATPLVLGLAPRLLRPFEKAPALSAFARRRAMEGERGKIEVSNHLLIVGFGLNGKNLARAASAASIPYGVVEMNPDTVRSERKAGTPMIYGDATNEAVLLEAGAARAKVAAVAINDPVATRRIVKSLRDLNPGLRIVARTRFTAEVAALQSLGADEVVPEEFETSIEIFTRVMRHYLLSRDEIDRLTSEIRSGEYRMLRSPACEPGPLDRIGPIMPDMDVGVFRVEEGMDVAGRTLEEMQWRKKHGITILAIQRRGGSTIPNPDGSERLLPGDRVVLMGKAEDVRRAAPFFSRSLRDEESAP